MSDVTRILSAIDQGDPAAAEKLLPLVYDELRKLAAIRLGQEKPGQTLQATALVHEAWLRLVGVESPQKWDGRRHFFAAAAWGAQEKLPEAQKELLTMLREDPNDRPTAQHGLNQLKSESALFCDSH